MTITTDAGWGSVLLSQSTLTSSQT